MIRLRRLLLLALLPLVAAPALAAPGGPALYIAEGSLARSQVVALGRDLEVDGEALAGVTALDGTVRISGRVGGDVVVVGGDVALAAGARVEGDVFVLGGEVEAAPGAVIVGRTVSYPTVSRAWLTLLEGPSLGLPASSPVVLGAKVALLAAWLVLVLALFATTNREVVATSQGAREDPFRCFLLGVSAIFALTLTGLLLSSLAVSVLGLPILFLVILLALLLKLWGMVAVFHALGDWATRRLARPLLPLHAATAGLLVLGAAKLVPWVGVWTWTAATFIGVGATLSTKFGRREPWLA